MAAKSFIGDITSRIAEPTRNWLFWMTRPRRPGTHATHNRYPAAERGWRADARRRHVFQPRLQYRVAVGGADRRPHGVAPDPGDQRLRSRDPADRQSVEEA